MSGSDGDDLEDVAAEYAVEAQNATGSVGELRQSIRGLLDDLGSTDSLAVGVAINGATLAAGLAVTYLFSGWVAAAGVGLAVLGAYPLVLAAWRAVA